VIRNVQILLKGIDQKTPILILAWKVKMGSDVAICKFKMHLS